MVRNATGAIPDLETTVLHLVIEHPGAKNKDLRSQVSASEHDVTRALTALEARGLLRREGQTRGTRWYPTGRPSTRASQTVPDTSTRDLVTSRRPTRGPAGGTRELSVLDGYPDMIGRVPDGEVARLAGVTRAAVTAYRRRRGIPSVREAREDETSDPIKSAPAVATAPHTEPLELRCSPAPTADGLSAWRVKRPSPQTEDVFVVASDIAGAAERAVAALGDTVVGVEWVGLVLD